MLPISLRTEGRRALIVGGGAVALRKAETLLAAGVTVHVVAPRIDARLAALAACTQRAYASTDLSDAQLVIAATGDPAINAQVIEDARAAHILCCDATQPERGDFKMQATLRVGDLTFAVDSGNSSPAFAKRLVREIGERFGPEYDVAAHTLARMRSYVKTVLEGEERSEVLRELAELPIEELASMNPSQAEHEVESVIVRRRKDDEHRTTNAVVCATRGSALALTQTRMVAARLAERGVATTLLNITTTGDRVQDKPIAAIGVNVWVKELELALIERRADYAVHSCKDLPGELTAGMQLAAISAREDPRDAFCSENYAGFDELPSGAVVGTSSLRRRAFLQALRPDLRYEDVRGNVDTRLRKLRDGQYDAIVLAMAGLKRLGVSATHTVPFARDVLVPSVGQGALAVETRAGEDRLAQQLRDAVNDHATEICVLAEREALRTLRAGCNAPLGIHACLALGDVHIFGAYAILERGTIVRHALSGTANSFAEAKSLGAVFAGGLAEKMAAPVSLVTEKLNTP